MKPTQVHNREELRGKSSQAELKLPEQEAGGSDFYLLKFNVGDAQFEVFQGGCS